jgi:transcriptional regulator with XRE-family HTH domain
MDISAYLEKHGLSQEKFAKQVGVTQSLVSQWLNGDTGITIDRVKRIVIETNGEITPHDLMPETFPPGFKFPKGPAAGDTGRGGKRVAA